MGYLTAANINGSDYKLAGALYGTCDTAAGTAAKVVTCADFDSLETGITIHVKFTYSNTAANATMNVNSTGAKNLCSYGTTRVGTTEATSWKAGAVVSFTYDGTSWVMNDYIPDTDNNTDTKVTQIANSSSNDDYPILFKKSSATSQVTDTVQFMSWVGTRGFAINPSTGNVTAVSYNGHVLAAASEKGVDSSIASGSTSTNLPTSAAVVDYVDSAVATATAGGLTYKGTATALTDITNTNYKKGWYWMVGTNPSITIDGQACEAGDMIIAKQDKTSTADNDLDVVQSNIVALTTAEIDADWAAA